MSKVNVLKVKLFFLTTWKGVRETRQDKVVFEKQGSTEPRDQEHILQAL